MQSMIQFGATRQTSERFPVLSVNGEVDLSTAPKLREMLEDLTRESHPDVVVDLSDVTFVDSVGYSVLVAAAMNTHALGENFWLVVDNPHLIKMIDQLGLTDVLGVIGERAEVAPL